MAKDPVITGFDESWGGWTNCTAGASDAANRVAMSTEDWRLRCTFLEGMIQAQTTMFEDMLLAKLECDKKLSEEKHEVASKVQHVTEENKKLVEQVNMLVQEKELLSTRVDENIIKHELASKENNKLTEKVITLIQEKDHLTAQAASELKKLEEEKAKLAATVRQITASLDISREENNRLMEKVDQLAGEKELLVGKEVKDELVAKLEEITASLDISQEENKKLVEQVNTLVQEKELLSTQLDENKIKHELANKENSKLTEKVITMVQEKDHLTTQAESELKRLSEEKAKLAAKVRQITASLDMSREENNRLLEKVDKLAGEKELISDQVEFEKQVKHELVTKVKEITASLDASREENKKLMITASLDSSQEQNKRLMEKVDKLAHEKELLSHQVESEKDVKHELVTKVKEITASLDASREENKKLVYEKEILSVQLEEFERTKDDHEKLKKGVLENQAVWKSSLDKCTNMTGSIDMLNGQVFRSGKTMWKIAVRRAGGMRVGVVSASESIVSHSNLGDTPGTWGCNSTGYAFDCGQHVERQEGFSYSSGSILMFILDLTGQGTLSAAVDAKPFVTLFTNMKSVATEFVPAVNLFHNIGLPRLPTMVEFLGFEELKVYHHSNHS